MATADEKIQTIIQILKDEFRPKRIILFGSRARGDHESDSDYDLVLIDATEVALREGRELDLG